MKLLKRNKVTLSYETYKELTEGTITEGTETYYTGEQTASYNTAVEFKASVSTPSGNASVQEFGILDSFDYIVVSDDVSLPITETTRITYDGKYYRVLKVAKSFNTVSIAIKRYE